jgi:hypothetical protein
VGTSEHAGGLDRVAANERDFLGGTRRRLASALIELRCECTHRLCGERIELTPEQYEPVRSSAARYAIYPHETHVDPGVDQVVEQQQSHWIVERQSSVEVLDFFATTTGTLNSELTSRVKEFHVTTPDPENEPDPSA